MVEYHPGKILLLAVTELGFGDVVNKFVVLIDTQHSVRQKTLHSKGTRDTDFTLVLAGLVVKVFEVCVCSDGGVDLLLAGDSTSPPVRVNLYCFVGPRVVDISGNFPLFIRRAESVV